jgi:hypothetical protein
MPDPYVALPWRVGTQVGRTLYVDHGDGEKHPEQLFGLVDTAELAAHIVAVHNQWLAGRDQ